MKQIAPLHHPLRVKGTRNLKQTKNKTDRLSPIRLFLNQYLDYYEETQYKAAPTLDEPSTRVVMTDIQASVERASSIWLVLDWALRNLDLGYASRSKTGVGRTTLTPRATTPRAAPLLLGSISVDLP